MQLRTFKITYNEAGVKQKRSQKELKEKKNSLGNNDLKENMFGQAESKGDAEIVE